MGVQTTSKDKDTDTMSMETLDSIDLEKRAAAHTPHSPYCPHSPYLLHTTHHACPCDSESARADTLEAAQDKRFPACLVFTTSGRIFLLILAVLFVMLMPLGIVGLTVLKQRHQVLRQGQVLEPVRE